MSAARAARLALALLAAAAAVSPAHELEATRLTVVAREEGHVSLALRVDFPELLRRLLAPEQGPGEFAVRCAARPDEEFAREQARAQAVLAARIRLELPGGREVRLGAWTWPDPTTVQAALRQRAMRELVDPGGHGGEPPVEIRAEGLAGSSLEGLALRLPAELRPLLVVSYRPDQTWVGRDQEAPVPVRF